MNRGDPWHTLGIDATADERAIKRAYAERLKCTRPEDDAAGYQHLRECRDVALEWARECADAAPFAGTDETDWMADAQPPAVAADPERPAPVVADAPDAPAAAGEETHLDLVSLAGEVVDELDVDPGDARLEALLAGHPQFDDLSRSGEIEAALMHATLGRRRLRADTLAALSRRFGWEQVGRERRHPLELLQLLDRRLALARAQQCVRAARRESTWSRGEGALERRAWRLLAGDFGRISRWLSVCVPGLAERAGELLAALASQVRARPYDVHDAEAMEFYLHVRELRRGLPDTVLLPFVFMLACVGGIPGAWLIWQGMQADDLRIALAGVVLVFGLFHFAGRVAVPVLRPLGLLIRHWTGVLQDSVPGTGSRLLMLLAIVAHASKPAPLGPVAAVLVLLAHRPEWLQWWLCLLLLSIGAPGSLFVAALMSVLCLLLLSARGVVVVFLCALQSLLLLAPPVATGWLQMFDQAPARPLLLVAALFAVFGNGWARGSPRRAGPSAQCHGACTSRCRRWWSPTSTSGPARPEPLAWASAQPSPNIGEGAKPEAERRPFGSS